jgi:type I site-specific restriction-modification system R (restriction) subunit
VIDNLYKLYSDLKTDGIIFCFSGPTSQSVVEGIGEALRHKMELEETSMTVSHRVFSIFVEQMQNVVNYSAEKVQNTAEEDNDLSHGMVVGKKGDRFYVISGNYIARDDAARIAGILDRLRAMGREELKAYYKEQRRRDPEAGSKGAGLGLIETARKASEPLSYELAEVDDRHAFLSINAVI